MNTPVKLPIAKLLKQKGWDKPIDSRWFYDTEYFTYRFSSEGATKWTLGEESSYPAPTISEVVMWLYENHGIWIVIDTLGNKNDYPKFDYKTISLSDLDSDTKWLMKKLGISYEELIANSYNTPTEAYEAALEYVLTNLILKKWHQNKK